jgi:hypothetical protein
MSKTRIWMMVVSCLIFTAASAQGQRKAGLWEVTSQMSMSGMPNMPAMGSHTQLVCVTQAMIDKYGGPYSNPQNAQCQVTNMSLTPTGMSADLSCTGRTSMTGTVKTTFVDANTTKTTMLMNMTMGNGQQMDMTMQSTAIFKGADCGSVQPLAMPPSQ